MYHCFYKNIAQLNDFFVQELETRCKPNQNQEKTQLAKEDGVHLSTASTIKYRQQRNLNSILQQSQIINRLDWLTKEVLSNTNSRLQALTTVNQYTGSTITCWGRRNNSPNFLAFQFPSCQPIRSNHQPIIKKVT